MAGRAKTLGSEPRENGSQRGSAGCCGAKCTRRAAAAPGSGKSRKRTAGGGRPLILGSAGGAAGSVQGLSRRVDTLSSLSPMRSVKWCREHASLFNEDRSNENTFSLIHLDSTFKPLKNCT